MHTDSHTDGLWGPPSGPGYERFSGSPWGSDLQVPSYYIYIYIRISLKGAVQILISMGNCFSRCKGPYLEMVEGGLIGGLVHPYI